MADIYLDLSLGSGGDGTSGNPYGSLSAMQTGETDKDISNDADHRNCLTKGSGAAFPASFTMSGWTTSATRRLRFIPWPGFEGNGTPGSYPRMVSSSGHVFIVEGAKHVDFVGMELHQSGSGASDECIRCTTGGTVLLVQKCLLHSSGSADDQDGIHVPSGDATVTVENSVIYTFRRCALGTQVSSGTHTLNVDSCLFFNTNSGTSEGEGGLTVRRLSGTYTVTINCYNTGSFLEGTGTANGYNSLGTPTSVTWNGTYNCCGTGDTSCTTLFGSGNGNINGVLLVTADGADDRWRVTNLTPGSYDWTPLAVTIGTDQCIEKGSTTLTEDIIGTARPVGVDDRGPFEKVAAGETITLDKWNVQTSQPRHPRLAMVPY
jgi:hypothetical protein